MKTHLTVIVVALGLISARAGEFVDNSDLAVLGEQESVAYMDWDAAKGMLVPSTVTRYLTVTEETDELEDGCFYVVSGEVTRTNSVKVSGSVCLLLTDSAQYSIQGDPDRAGLVVEEGSSISIFAQAEGLGSLTARGGRYGAGIGADLADRSVSSGRAGAVRIFGGRITSKGGMAAAGIGGGRDSAADSGGTVTIAGGTVVAQGGDGSSTFIMSEGCGIGCGGRFDGGNMPRYSAGTLTILGGSVLISGAAADQPAIVPSNGTERVSCLTIELPADFEPTGRQLTICGLDGYGTQGVFPVDGKLAFWLPDGEVTPIVEGVALDTVTVSGENQILSASDQPCVVYRDADGMPQTRHCTPFSSDLSTLEDGRWYVVTGEVSMSRGPVVGLAGRVILADDARLTVTNEWRIEEGKTLTIYGSERGTGELTVGGGIVGGYMTSYGAMRAGGSLTVNGGQISTVGTGGSAAVGGFTAGCPGMTVTVNGGYLLAVSSGSGAAIGGGGSSGGSSRGGSGGIVTINGGTVVAQVDDEDLWHKPGGSIGGGYNASDRGSLTINGGAVYAKRLGTAPNATPKRDGQTLYRVKMYLDDPPASGPVDIRGIDGYCLRDIYPVDGVVCLYLPSGDYSFTVDGVPYGATVAGKNVIALRTDRQIVYVDSDGRDCETPCRFLTSETSALEDGCWYAVTGTIERATMSLEGSAQLILTDGARLCVTGAESQAGFAIAEGQTLTVYGQTAGTGLLLAQGGDRAAGIGGTDHYKCGTLSVCSGTVKSTGGYMSEGGIIGTVRIAGGCVSAYGGEGRSDGLRGSSVLVSGGRLFAVGSVESYGIYVTGKLTVSGGTVIARGDYVSSDISYPGPISGGQIVAQKLLTQPKGNDGEHVYEVMLQVPDGTPEDRPVAISGLGDYGVKDIYPASGVVRLWLPNGTYENVTVAGVSHSFVVNGDSVGSLVERQPFSYQVMDEASCQLKTVTTNRYLDVTEETFALKGGYCYRVSGFVVRNAGIAVQGSATLVLCDESSLVVTGRLQEAGIGVGEGATLTVCGQQGGTGVLEAIGRGNARGIGADGKGFGTSSLCGTVVFHGGRVNAGEGSAAIGSKELVGTIRIYGGAFDSDFNARLVSVFGGIFRYSFNRQWLGVNCSMVSNTDPVTKDEYPQRVIWDCFDKVTVIRGTGLYAASYDTDVTPLSIVFANGASQVTLDIVKRASKVTFYLGADVTSDSRLRIPVFLLAKNGGSPRAVPSVCECTIVDGDRLEFSAIDAGADNAVVTEAVAQQALKDAMPKAADKIDVIADVLSSKDMAAWIVDNNISADMLLASDYVVASVWLDSDRPLTEAMLPEVKLEDFVMISGMGMSFCLKINGSPADYNLSQKARGHIGDMIILSSDLGDWTTTARIPATYSFDRTTSRVRIVPNQKTDCAFARFLIPKDPL